MRTSSGSTACLPRRALQPAKNTATLDLSQALLSPQARDALTALSNNALYSSSLNSDDILRALNAGVLFDVDDVVVADERPTVAREPSLVDWMRAELNLGAAWPTRGAAPKPVESVNLALEVLTPQARDALTALSMIARSSGSPPLDSDDILEALNAGSAQNGARAFGWSARAGRMDAQDAMPFEGLLSPRAREALTAIAHGKRRSPDADELLNILNGVETAESDEDETGDSSMTDLLSSLEWQSDSGDDHGYDDTEFTDAMGRTAPPTPEAQWQSESDSEESQTTSEDANEMTGNSQFEAELAARLMREVIVDECDAIDDILMNMKACSQWPLAVVDDTEPAWVGDLLGEFFTARATRLDDCDEAQFSATHVQREECPSVVHLSSYDVPVPSLLGVLEGECTFEEYWTTSPPLVTTLPLLFGYQGMNESEEHYESGSKDGSWGWDQEDWENASLEYI